MFDLYTFLMALMFPFTLVAFGATMWMMWRDMDKEDETEEFTAAERKWLDRRKLRNSNKRFLDI